MKKRIFPCCKGQCLYIYNFLNFLLHIMHFFNSFTLKKIQKTVQKNNELQPNVFPMETKGWGLVHKRLYLTKI